jgi:hypothetical protein
MAGSVVTCIAAAWGNGRNESVDYSRWGNHDNKSHQASIRQGVERAGRSTRALTVEGSLGRYVPNPANAKAVALSRRLFQNGRYARYARLPPVQKGGSKYLVW